MTESAGKAGGSLFSGDDIYLFREGSHARLYQRLGFATRSEWDVAGGGPHFWTMTRPAEPDPTTP